ncbi:hypothetical protein EVAR_76061_1 [Eumeta japonica]|uniref:Uncharacterized protein n=1 Tax=Eumeta variegata TaxID=151549 RepID=A0A4C1W2M7_EUMVA|nr:hypothetical protein EVAR_76061_1 [Eumeta japonica]
MVRTYEEIIKEFKDGFQCEINYAQLFYNTVQKEADLAEYFYKIKRLGAEAKFNKENTTFMTFLPGLKAYVKSLLHKPVAELKSAITNYKLVYEENPQAEHAGRMPHMPVTPSSVLQDILYLPRMREILKYSSYFGMPLH